MAQVRFDDVNTSQTNNFSEGPRVGFFSLKNDGDEAVVRIMHNSTGDFDILTTHQVTVNGSPYRKVSCIRDPHDSMDKCPLCASGAQVQRRIYIHLIQYKKDANGNIVAEPKVWERSMSYAEQLKDLIQEYGPLSEQVFKIRRSGVAGSMDTRYSILYGNPQVYRTDLYPAHPEMFDGYKALGTVVMDKSFDEIATYVSTGNFPQKAAANNNAPASPAAPVAPTPAPTYQAPVAPTPGPAYNNTYNAAPVEAPRQAPWDNNPAPAQQMDRPVRYY